ncbi:MAG: TatD family hydrolase, partial [Pseudobdellovibrionaceae bacterium]
EFIDSHCHLSDPRLDPTLLQQMMSSAAEMRISRFVQGGVGPEEWQKQIELASRFPKKVILCLGLHPMWVADHDEEECEKALDLLAPLLPKAKALGEMGLDFRPHYRNHSEQLQVRMFEEQLELAEAAELPAVLHLVQAHEFAIRILDVWGSPKKGGFAHSFNGSSQKAEDLMRRGFSLSVGGPVTYSNNKTLRTAVEAIPMERLLLETDAPDQPPFSKKGQLHGPASLWEIAETVGHIKALDPEEVLEASSANVRRLLNLEKN